MASNSAFIPDLVRYAERTLDREANLILNSGIAHSREFDRERVKPIVDYLLHPYEHGFWSFSGVWCPDAPIFRYLLEELGTLDEINEVQEAKGSSFVARQLSEEKREELVHVTSRLSGLHFLFLAAKNYSDGDALLKIHDRYSWIRKIDLGKFNKTFASACEEFKKKVYFKKYNPGVGQTNRLISTAEGLVNYLHSPRTSGRLCVAAGDKKSLQGLFEFYNILGVVENSKIERIFSPEEKLFSPYFEFLSGVFSYVILDERIEKFSQALDYYRASDFTHSISTLGLMAEDYLTRIYVTLLREQCAPGMTLGQLNHTLHKRIVDILQPPKGALRSVDDIFAEIGKLEDCDTSSSYKAIYRNLLSLIVDDRAFFGKRIDELKKDSPKISPFPPRIRDNITELLEFRNAASHNTRVPLGEFEAVRTLYCLVSVVNWWQEFLENTDWTNDRNKILSDAVLAAK